MRFGRPDDDDPHGESGFGGFLRSLLAGVPWSERAETTEVTTLPTRTVRRARAVEKSSACRTAMTIATSAQAKPRSVPSPGMIMSKPGAAAKPRARCISPMSAQPP